MEEQCYQPRTEKAGARARGGAAETNSGGPKVETDHSINGTGTAYPCTAYVLGAGSKVGRRQNINILN